MKIVKKKLTLLATKHLINQPANTETGTETDTDTSTDLDIEFVVMDETELERPYRVIIHNDNVTTFDFVLNSPSVGLNTLLTKPTPRARLMWLPSLLKRPRVAFSKPSMRLVNKVFPSPSL